MIQVSQFHLFLLLSVSTLVFADDTNTDKPNVIIVGAGAAGISAASKLLEHGGFEVEILEAGQRYGGRINNLYKDNYYKALGAEWYLKKYPLCVSCKLKVYFSGHQLVMRILYTKC